MKRLSLDIRLLIVFLVLLSGSILSDSYFSARLPLEYGETMREAVKLTEQWFSEIDKLKREKGVVSDISSNVPYSFMIGDEWSEITSTLGSLESKETSTNPDFSALIVRMLYEADIKKGDQVGVILSGSFPALAISVFAALQTMDIDAIVMSSVAASTYGANQPEVCWLDMESRLAAQTKMKYRSSLVSAGGGRDVGEGLTEEGMADIREAAERNGVSLYIPSSLIESIETRAGIFQKEGISLLINIGGNQAALGGCSHSFGIPNGLNYTLEGCSDKERGVLTRLNESGVPYINMLNIKELASRYGIAVSPGASYSESINLYEESRRRSLAIAIIMIVGLLSLILLRKGREHRID